MFPLDLLQHPLDLFHLLQGSLQRFNDLFNLTLDRP
jgi:hypothetical protein